MTKRYSVRKPFRKCGRRKPSVVFRNYIRHIYNLSVAPNTSEQGFLLPWKIFGLPVVEVYNLPDVGEIVMGNY